MASFLLVIAGYQPVIEKLSKPRVTHVTALSIHSTLINHLKVIRLEWLAWLRTEDYTYERHSYISL